MPRREAGGAAKAFVEAHIEQGPVLEREHVTIGAVTGIQGRRSFVVDVIGADAHGGTSRPSERKDALLAAVNMVHALQQVCTDGTDDLRFTVGVFNAFPGAPLVVPGRVHFTVDVRHPDNDIMQRVGDQVREVCQRNRGPCEVVVAENANAASIYFPENMVALAEREAARFGYPCRRILSLAGHDGRELVKVCPTGMVFVPCRAGVSHNETESATARDLAAGTKVLLGAVCELAGVRA
jgi:N-carbamoyl-L-amino-acid hydrolase